MISMSDQKVKEFHYSEENFLHQTIPWEQWKSSRNLSPLDRLIHTTWDDAMEKGAFRYGLEEIEARVVPGKCRFVLQLNLKRGTERRKPDHIMSVKQPFDHQKFNFNKVKSKEIICTLCHHRDHNLVAPPEQLQCNGHDGVDHTGTNQNRGSDKHMIVVNVSPLEYGHILLTPDVNKCLPQQLTLRAASVAVHTILLTAHPRIVLIFNGLCALASVNHLHLHAWYNSESLYVEDAPVSHLTGPLHEMVGMPTRAFVFQLHGNSVEDLTRHIHRVTSCLLEMDVAHNVVLTRGPQLGEQAGSTKTTVRAYIWPRVSVTGTKNETGLAGVFNVAGGELAGHIPMFDPAKFTSLTEEQIESRIQEFMLPDEQYEEVKKHLMELFEPDDAHLQKIAQS